MKRTFLLFFLNVVGLAAFCQEAIEAYTYSNNFESGRLGAWASYPLWQDNAYDQNFQVRKLISGDSNLSVVQKVTPYSRVDNYAGAQKLLDMYLVSGSKITLRYYLKSATDAAFFKIRLAAGAFGKVDVTLAHPVINKWTWVTVGFDDFLRENAGLAGKDPIRIYALAFLAKVSKADPDMPIYLGLDDISFEGARPVSFRFDLPAMYKLPEFAEFIPQRAYHQGDTFFVKGRWPVGADRVSLNILSFTNEQRSFFQDDLSRTKEGWEERPLKLSLPEGLYRGKLVAYKHSAVIGETSFTIHIDSRMPAGRHPRLLFDEAGKARVMERLKEPGMQGVYANLLKDAKAQRGKVPVERLKYDLDQFPDEHWLPSWVAFGEHIYSTGPALKSNALAYAFSGDTVAGNYVRSVLVKLSGWPEWVSPWMIKRGRYDDHRMGTWSHDVALAYDLVYGLMTPQETALVRKGIFAHIIQGAHYTYVYDNEIIANSSNWIAHIMGGSLMSMAAIEGDGPETTDLEPYFTGAVLKFYHLLTHVTDTTDGAWGEGWAYNNYTFSNLAYSIPTLKNVYNIDVSAPLEGTFNEYIWGGLIRDRKWFGFGDSGDSLLSADNWAFLLAMDRSPRLSWYYHYLKSGMTLDDALFDVKDIPQESPFKEDPNKVFRRIGTTVFKSGWEKNDFTFVMRTGAFFNHQHLDQGSFWLADRGITFIEDQPIHNSDYYLDPLYQPAFIQPVAHSTILIDGNAQSQRTGDPPDLAPGFDDHAFIGDYLDGGDAAFSSGDIGRLYWGEVNALTRNILFLKPRSLLMLDVAVPGKKDAEITLLYHTKRLADIDPGGKFSRITKEGVSLNLVRLSPDTAVMRAVETPHYLNTLIRDTLLEKEGMLTESAHTAGRPLVMANILTTTAAGESPDVTSKKGDGFVSGEASGRKFIFSSEPGHLYTAEGMETDALAVTYSDSSVFVALATVFRKKGGIAVNCDSPMTFECKGNMLRYYRHTGGEIRVFWKGQRKAKVFRVPEGQGVIRIR
jgi:hypothetical protein